MTFKQLSRRMAAKGAGQRRGFYWDAESDDDLGDGEAPAGTGKAAGRTFSAAEVTFADVDGDVIAFRRGADGVLDYFVNGARKVNGAGTVCRDCL